jgi:hypothetical protein
MTLTKKLTSLMLILSVTGCASIPSDYCAIARPIVYEQSDVDVISEKLVNSILRHNEKYRIICRWLVHVVISLCCLPLTHHQGLFYCPPFLVDFSLSIFAACLSIFAFNRLINASAFFISSLYTRHRWGAAYSYGSIAASFSRSQ